MGKSQSLRRRRSSKAGDDPGTLVGRPAIPRPALPSLTTSGKPRARLAQPGGELPQPWPGLWGCLRSLCAAQQPSADAPFQLSCLKGTGGDKLAGAASPENAGGAANPQGFAERACGGRGLVQGRQEPGGVISSGKKSGPARLPTFLRLRRAQPKDASSSDSHPWASRAKPGERSAAGHFEPAEGHGSGMLSSQAKRDI